MLSLKQAVDNVKRFVAVNGVRSTYTDFGVRNAGPELIICTPATFPARKTGICRRFISDFRYSPLIEPVKSRFLPKFTVTYHYCFSHICESSFSCIFITCWLPTFHILVLPFPRTRIPVHCRVEAVILYPSMSVIITLAILNHYGCSNQRFDWSNQFTVPVTVFS